MKDYTYIHGTINVIVMGRTQEEKEYILKTIINHLPIVSGADGNMNVYLIKAESNDDGLMSHNEFFQKDNHGKRKLQSRYIIVVDGQLSDREFQTTLKEFSKWMCRLANRCSVIDVSVKVWDDYDKCYVFTNCHNQYSDLEETMISYNNNGNPTWCEYLMWKNSEGNYYGGMPKELIERYGRYRKDDCM